MEGGQGRTSVTNWPGGEVERRSGGRAPERWVHCISKERDGGGRILDVGLYKNTLEEGEDVKLVARSW